MDILVKKKKRKREHLAIFYLPAAISMKWVKDLNKMAKTVKLLGKNHRDKFSHLGFGKVLLDMTSKA